MAFVNTKVKISPVLMANVSVKNCGLMIFFISLHNDLIRGWPLPCRKQHAAYSSPFNLIVGLFVFSFYK